MTETVGTQVNTPESPSEKGDAERLAVLFAGVAATQSVQSPGQGSGQNAIHEALRDLLDNTLPWKGEPIKELHDAILVAFGDPTEALKAGIHMQRNVANQDGKTPFALRMVIHYSSGLADNHDGPNGDMALFAAQAASFAKPGHIYLSPEACDALRELKSVKFRPVALGDNVFPGHSFVHEVTWSPETDCTPNAIPVLSTPKKGDSATRFLYGPALIEGGENVPCFYCGSKKHPTTRCPSKQLPYRACGLEALASLSMAEINNLFSTYLAQAGKDLSTNPEPPEAGNEYFLDLAPWSFYELKRVFQLRFLNLVWCASSRDDWYKMKENKRETSAKGGTLWLARDCIRVSQLNEAEDFLARFGREHVKDYRMACGLAFVHIERGSWEFAADFCNEALALDVTPLQRTYLLLLLSRVYAFSKDVDKSSWALKEALRTEPYCLEARFEEMVRCFQEGQPTDAVSRLFKLLRFSHEYWAAALISPELTEFQPLFAAEFRKLGMDAAKEAQVVSREADAAVVALKGFLGDNDEGAAEILSMQEQMRALAAKSDAILASRDAIRISQKIIAECAVLEKKRRDAAKGVLVALQERVDTLLHDDNADTAKLLPLVRSMFERLCTLEEGLKRREPAKRFHEQCRAISMELAPIEEASKQLKERAQSLRVRRRFFRDLAIILTVTVLTGLFILPLLAICADALHPQPITDQPAELWLAQKAVFVVGILFAGMFALGHWNVLKGKGKEKGGEEGKERVREAKREETAVPKREEEEKEKGGAGKEKEKEEKEKKEKEDKEKESKEKEKEGKKE